MPESLSNAPGPGARIRAFISGLPLGPNRAIVTFTVLSVIVLLAFGNVATRVDTVRGTLHIAVLFILAVVLPISLVAIVISFSFRQGPRLEVIQTILISYFCLVCTFTAGYYALIGISDYTRASDEYAYLECQRTGRSDCQPDKPRAAFTGLNETLWKVVPGATSKDTGVVKDKAERIPALLDSMHFSVITMTTVGYGDISPQSHPARVASDIQALLSVALFGVALSAVLARRDEPG